MGTIYANDECVATVIQYGKAVDIFEVTGINNIFSLHEIVRNRLADNSGLVSVVLRNITQGWTDRAALMLGRDTGLTLGLGRITCEC